MPGLNFIAINTVNQSPPCQLCGKHKIEWSCYGNITAWLCFECDINCG
jgi:hypothetical protein